MRQTFFSNIFEQNENFRKFVLACSDGDQEEFFDKKVSKIKEFKSWANHLKIFYPFNIDQSCALFNAVGGSPATSEESVQCSPHAKKTPQFIRIGSFIVKKMYFLFGWGGGVTPGWEFSPLRLGSF